MAEELAGGLCVCWLLPLALLGGVVLISNAIGLAWRDRGLERGSVYCAGCRFNLEGCASWNCPECGAHLDEGRVMTPGHDRPLPLFPRVLLVVLAAAGPLVLVGVLLAWVVPVNYETSRTLALMPLTESIMHNASRIEVQGYGEVAWVGRGRPKMLYLEVTRWHQFTQGRRLNKSYELPLPAGDADLLLDRTWSSLLRQCYFDDETPAWRAEARTDLVSAMRYIAGEDGTTVPELKRFHVQERTYRRFEPAPFFVMVVFLLGLVILGLIIRWTVRWHGRVADVYVHRHARLAEKVNGLIEHNRAQAGLGVAARESGEDGGEKRD